jgi:pimeloyl-[acyl-carrier protein] methyl ester esterase
MRADVLLLPGLHGSTRLFQVFVALAPSWARCRAVALPPEAPQGFDALADALLPSFRPFEGMVIVAESFSGPIAVRLTAGLGAKVALLVLCNPLTVPSFAAPVPLTARFLQSRLCLSSAAAYALAGGDRALGKAVIEEVRALPRPVLEQRLAVTFAACAADISAYAVAPLLCILGTKDRVVAATTTREALATIPRVIITEVSAPHMILQTHPSQVWALITSEYECAA